MKFVAKLPFFLLKIIIRREKKNNREFWSETLRLIFKERYNIEVGYGSYGCFDVSKFPPGTKIGNYCSIAGGVRYFNANHPMNYATTHPAFYNPLLRYTKEDVIRSNIVIGNDVWIGYGVLITSSCNTIGDGAIIGAGSVVTRDVDPYTIVAGNPAKLIKTRFDKETIKKLNDSKWFELEIDHLIKYIDSIDEPAAFAQMVKNNEK